MFDESIVVHYRDGRTLTGWGDNFFPTEGEIFVKDMLESVVKVSLAEVKVVCFVKQLNTDRRETHRPAAPLIFQPVPGNRVDIVFRDGERMEGIASLTRLPDHGFFVTPLNPNSNNLQVYVNPAAVLRLRIQTPATGAPA